MVEGPTVMSWRPSRLCIMGWVFLGLAALVEPLAARNVPPSESVCFDIADSYEDEKRAINRRRGYIPCYSASTFPSPQTNEQDWFIREHKISYKDKLLPQKYLCLE